MKPTATKRLDDLAARLLGEAPRDELWRAFFRHVESTWPAERQARLHALWDKGGELNEAERAEFDGLILADAEADRLLSRAALLAHLEYCAQNGAVYGRVNPYAPE